MLRRVAEYVKCHNMLKARDKVVVGVSGGADSMCLFFVLLGLKEEYQLTLYVVHINHGIRGKDADEDEDFVRACCKAYGVEFCGVRVDVKAYAKERGFSEEEAGRTLRYQVFSEVLLQYQGNKIAVAHNQNDQAETVLFHLFRGSGIKGLSGMEPVRGQIIRPLLCVGRDDIEQYLDEKQRSFRTDQTNFTDAYTRNRIRLHILPYVKEHINREAVEHISRSANMLREVETYIEMCTIHSANRIVVEENGQYSFYVKDFKEENIVIQKKLMRYIISKLVHNLKDIGEEHIRMLLSLQDKPVGKRMNLPLGICGERGYETIRVYIIRPNQNEEQDVKRLNESSGLECLPVEVVIPGDCYIQTIDSTLQFLLINYKKNLIIPKNRYTKWFDYDKINSTIFLRSRTNGDFMQINSQGSTKKLKNIFIDNKVPRDKRDDVLLLADGKHIMWIIGDRISEAYKVDEGTKKILVVELFGGKNDVRQDQSDDF